MKTRFTSTLALLITLITVALAPLSGAPTATAAYGFTIEKVGRGDQAEIIRGITQMTVLRLMGPAHRKLSPDVWVYLNHPLDSDMANARGCNILVVTFAGGKVSDLTVVNDRAAAYIAENLKGEEAASRVARK